MIVVLSGTNRPQSNTRKVAGIVEAELRGRGEEVTLLDLMDLPSTLLSPSAYAEKPADFAVFQDAILAADGILTVTPEYNGSFPGVLKVFLDMLRFPESLLEKPAAFVGVAAGRWGALRSVEQLEMIFQYRCAHLYGHRVFIPAVHGVFDDDGGIDDEQLRDRLAEMVRGFAGFCNRLC